LGQIIFAIYDWLKFGDKGKLFRRLSRFTALLLGSLILLSMHLQLLWLVWILVIGMILVDFCRQRKITTMLTYTENLQHEIKTIEAV
jgi:hypothetical protein